MAVKYFLGLTLMQIIAAAMMAIWWQMPSLEMAVIFAGLLLTTNFFATLWLSSLAWGDAREIRAKLDGKYKEEILKIRAEHRETLLKMETEHKDALAKAKHDLSRERDRQKLQVERETAKAVEQARKAASKETGRIQAKANMKVGTAVVGVVGLGGMLLLTQLMSLGVVLMAASGGALGGYVWRLRQESRRRNQQALETQQVPITARIINRVTPKAMPDADAQDVQR